MSDSDTGSASNGRGYAPAQRYAWLRPYLPKALQPYLRGLRKRFERMRIRRLPEPYRTVFPYSQVGQARQRSLVDLVAAIDREAIPGSIVECGVLDGGTAALMAWASRGSTLPRHVHLFDAWRGLPATTLEDGTESAKWTGEVVGSPVRVRAVMRSLGIPLSRIVFHHGWFDKTFPYVNISPVALVHIDCDFYEPTRLCLDKWYSVLSPGGYIQFDDYLAFSGCTRAVDEFLSSHPELTLRSEGAFKIRKPGY
jgi:O-methyltransferase